MKDGVINLDEEFSESIGFTSDKFSGYLWKKGKTIIISLITSKDEGNGNLISLFDNIVKNGFDIQVPTPSYRMESICLKYGLKKCIEHDEMFGEVEVMK